MFTKVRYRSPSDAELHDSYALAHRIDERAPLRGRQTVTVAAPVAQVWAKLSDVAHWADNLEPDVHDIRLTEAGVASGATFSRRSGGVRLAARFAVVDPLRELSWTGRALGIVVVHRFVLQTAGEKATTVTVEESMAGRMLVVFSQSKLDAVLARSLATLKSAAEASSAPLPMTAG